MNYLELAPADRPVLQTRERVAGRIEVCCPTCGIWRPGFTLQPSGGDPAWFCDREISALERT